MQTNQDGWIALRYYQSTQVLVQKTPSRHDYVFVPQANISLAWIRPEDVDNILARKKGCCGGHKRNSYLYANENDVRQWTNKGGR